MPPDPYPMTAPPFLPLVAAAPPARRAWRTPVVVSLGVAAAHLALLGWTPAGMAPDPAPKTERFITRTIVVAPPPPPPPAATPTPAPRPPAAPAKTPPSKPARQRPAPAPAVVAAPAPSPEPMPQSPMASDPPAALSAAASATAPDATGPASAAGEGDAASAPAAAPAVAATPTASAPAAAIAEAPPLLQVPGSVRLKFAVTGQQGVSPLSGVFGELTWQQDGQAYDARLSLSFLFKTLRTQHSAGVIGPSGIEPTRFSDTRKTEVASHFVRDQGQIVFSSNAPPVPLMPGAQDRLSVMLQLGALLAGDPARYPTDGAIAVQTAGPRDADLWIFKVGEEEGLQLPAGDFRARKLTRNARKPYDDTVELWLAPALGFLPVRIKLTQANGDFADMRLRERLPLDGEK